MDRLTLNVLLSEIELPHRRPEMSAQQLVEEGFPMIPVKELDQTAEVSGVTASKSRGEPRRRPKSARAAILFDSSGKSRRETLKKRLDCRGQESVHAAGLTTPGALGKGLRPSRHRPAGLVAVTAASCAAPDPRRLRP
jgi:hypothetical protein